MLLPSEFMIAIKSKVSITRRNIHRVISNENYAFVNLQNVLSNNSKKVGWWKGLDEVKWGRGGGGEEGGGNYI